MKKLLLLLTALWAIPAFAQFSISQLPPATTPLTGTEVFPCTQAGATKKCLTSSVAAAVNATFLLQSANASLPLSRRLVGTANEILLADGGPLGDLVLSTPQPIATTSDVTFHSMILTVPLTVPNGGIGVGTISGLLVGNGVSAVTPYAGTSCTNQFVRALGSTGAATCNTVANTDLANSSITLNGAAIALGGTRVLSLASADFVNQGTATTLLHGNAAGNPVFSAVANADMVNSSLTLNGASIALGGTRTLSLASADFVNQGTTTTVLHGNAAGNPAFGAVTSSDLAAGVFANPSGLIGLTAANGVATTATRSDATHAIDQAIVPTWSGVHTFSATSVFSNTTGFQLSNATPQARLTATGAAANQLNTLVRLGSTGGFAVSSATDAAPTAAVTDALVATRTGSAWATVSIGNSTDNTAVSFPGNGILLHDGASAAAGVVQSIFRNSTATGYSSIRVYNDQNTAVRAMEVDYAGSTYASVIATGGPTGEQGAIGTNGNFPLTLYTNGNSRLSITGAGSIAMPSITNTAAAQTGTMCWAAAAISYDTTVGCLTSSIRFKQAIIPLDDGLISVIRMRPVSYDIKPEYDSFHLGRQVGMIAEEVEKIDPRLVGYEPDGKTVRGIRYQQLTAVLVKAIQQQQLEIYALWLALAGSFAFTYFRTKKKG